LESLFEGLKKAFLLICSFDSEVVSITFLSLKVSGLATIISLFLGVPTAIVLNRSKFFGRTIIIALVNTSMGLPPVVVGLFVAIMLWRSGPFGFLGVLYTPLSMIIAQAILSYPVVTGITLAGLQQLPRTLELRILSLGATRFQMFRTLLRQIRVSLLMAVIAGFGCAISEVGASMMVGGNIRGYTRVLTTSIMTETSMGNFDNAIALAIILFILAFSISVILTKIQQKGKVA